MGAFRKLSADWQPIWNAAPVQARTYLGKFVRFLVDEGLQTNDVRQEHLAAWSGTLSGREAAVGHINSVVNKYNALRRPDGSALPHLERLENRNDRRAAINADLSATILDEIARTRRYLEDINTPQTVDAIERRLLEVARHPHARRRTRLIPGPRRPGPIDAFRRLLRRGP